ncbi:MAG: serine/threonine-protein kinase [Pirellulaceae bacterium]|nr:serine/threonine-protein kinase [Pirellulaceae bacterium]
MSILQPASPSNASLLIKAAAELERCLRENQVRACESVLEKFPQLNADADAVLELIYLEYVLRQESGQEQSSELFLSKFPQNRDEVLKLLQVDEAIRSKSNLHPTAKFAEELDDTHSEANEARLPKIDQIGDYSLLEVIGRGGMGVVYKAEQKKLGRLVAVKTIDSFSSFNPSLVMRFKSEAELAARLQHPNIVQIHEINIHSGVPFFSMELVSGGTLAEATQDHPLQPLVAARLMEILARAVHYAHSHGVGHRDLKPANVLLAPSLRSEAMDLNPSNSSHRTPTPAGKLGVEPKIADFGLAKDFKTLTQSTVAGTPIGTPSYMAPEQADRLR